MDCWSGDVLKALLDTSEQLVSFHTAQLELLQTSFGTALPTVNVQLLTHLSHFVQVSRWVAVTKPLHAHVSSSQSRLVSQNFSHAIDPSSMRSTYPSPTNSLSHTHFASFRALIYDLTILRSFYFFHSVGYSYSNCCIKVIHLYLSYS